ncbi:hypothetical protein GCM10009007_11390 [Formosimonas limnophila]|uniref:Secreted protein n=1 Tax=Formosimonas limnophila TaxID=1384487 RepID=A0A8J3CNE3_9BURK|nr:hypothetical protein [Formosimonas limnophila]GHA72157.1 hypothetical protein GCM10009007_11390 [Formosimonas limnophila]
MKTTKKFTLGALMTAVSLMSATSAFACNSMKGEHHKQVHEQAIAACQGKIEGSSVTVNNPMWGNVTAVCAPDHDGTLAAMPPKMVEYRNAAIAACQGKSKGDKVSLQSWHEAGTSVEATCVQGKNGQGLMARPANMKKHMENKNDM